MSLRTQIQQAVQVGLAALDDIPELATYQHAPATPTYNASTGESSAVPTPYPGIRIVFTSFRRDEIDGTAIRAEDQKAVIAVRDLTPTPTINDKITRADGNTWSVIGIRVDPAGAAWVLQIRTP